MYGVEIYHEGGSVALSSSEPYEAREIIDDLEEEFAEELGNAFSQCPNGLEGALTALIVTMSVLDSGRVSMTHNGYRICMTR